MISPGIRYRIEELTSLEIGTAVTLIDLKNNVHRITLESLKSIEWESWIDRAMNKRGEPLGVCVVNQSFMVLTNEGGSTKNLVSLR